MRCATSASRSASVGCGAVSRSSLRSAPSSSRISLSDSRPCCSMLAKVWRAGSGPCPAPVAASVTIARSGRRAASSRSAAIAARSPSTASRALLLTRLREQPRALGQLGGDAAARAHEPAGPPDAGAERQDEDGRRCRAEDRSAAARPSPRGPRRARPAPARAAAAAPTLKRIRSAAGIATPQRTWSNVGMPLTTVPSCQRRRRRERCAPTPDHGQRDGADHETVDDRPAPVGGIERHPDADRGQPDGDGPVEPGARHRCHGGDRNPLRRARHHPPGRTSPAPAG